MEAWREYWKGTDMALGSRLLNLKGDNMGKQKMFFMIDDPKFWNLIHSENNFKLEDDSSLLYDGLRGNYSVLIGGNWRFELVVDSSTGLCTQIRSFLQQMSVIEADLVLPKSEKKDLFFYSNSDLVAGGGCHYFPFQNSAFWDEKKKILCYGNPNSEGQKVHFIPQVYAIIKSGQLKCIFMDLQHVNGEISFK